MFQIVLDTNVLLSALRSAQGAAFRLLNLIGDERFRLNVSVALVLEYEDVLKRPEMNLNLTFRDVDDVINFICGNANLRDIFYLWRPMLRDPKDDFILELAVESDCDFIVTYNIKDFAGVEIFGVKPITPAQFLREIGEIK